MELRIFETILHNRPILPNGRVKFQILKPVGGVRFTVYDAAGRTVSVEDITAPLEAIMGPSRGFPPGTTFNYVWKGRNANGERVAVGAYYLSGQLLGIVGVHFTDTNIIPPANGSTSITVPEPVALTPPKVPGWLPVAGGILALLSFGKG